MKILLLFLPLLTLTACVTPTTKAPSTTPASQHVGLAGTANNEIKAASARSSKEITRLRSNANQIDYKAQRALELL